MQVDIAQFQDGDRLTEEELNEFFQHDDACLENRDEALQPFSLAQSDSYPGTWRKWFMFFAILSTVLTGLFR